jgi:hypothetical protein
MIEKCLGAGLAAFISGCAAPGANWDEPWTVEPRVRDEAALLLTGYRPLKPLARTLQVGVVDVPGIFRAIPYEGRTLYIPQDAGLLSIESKNTSPRGVSTLDKLSVCGLITILSHQLSPFSGGSVD